MLAFLRLLNPLGMLQGAIHSSGAVVADFFGTPSKKGRKTVLLLILLGLLVLIPQLRVKLAERHAKALAQRTEELQADVARAELSKVSAEQQRDAEAEARVIEREEARKSAAASDEYLKLFAAREATVTNRLKEITNALNARKAGDAVAGDSAVILRNLGKVGVESVSATGDHRETAPGPAGPVPSAIGPAAGAGPDAGPVVGGSDRTADGGVRETASAGGAQ